MWGESVKRIVFCDFDGTITARETFEAVIKQFAPELSARLLPQMYARELTIREGVRQILESIPSSRYPEIIELTRPQHSGKPGFSELLDFLEVQGVPLVVVSGGLRGMVEAVLGSLVERVHGIHAIDVDTSGAKLVLRSPYEAGTEMVAKVKVIEAYAPDQAIAIGDSLTDLNMALVAPLVFARDRLAKYLDEHQKPYIPWNDFFTVRDYLAALWK